MAPPVASFRAQIQGFDTWSLLRQLAALELVQSNSSRLYRLQTAAELAASDWQSEGATPSRARLRRVLEQGPLVEIAHQEDPFNDVLYEELPFHGGSYLVPNGLMEQSGFILARLLEVLVRERMDEFTERLQPMTLATLRLLDQCMRAAGLARHVPPAVHPGVTIPSASRMAELEAALEFTMTELDGILAPVCAPADLGALVTGAGAGPGWDSMAPYGPLSLRPLVRDGDRLLMATPTAIPGALVHALVSGAIELGARDALAHRFRTRVHETAMRALRRMGMRREDLDPPDPSGLPAEQQVFRFDRDKLAVLVTLCDDLESYDQSTTGGGNWTPDSERIEQHLNAVVEMVSSAGQSGAGLVILAVQSMGRGVGLGFQTVETEPVVRLTCEASELPLLAIKEEDEPLGLWKFARAAAELYNATNVLAWHRLDLYGMYRDYERSFSFPDGGVPDTLTLDLDFGTQVRIEAKQASDPHSARYIDDSVVDVERLDVEMAEVPVYTPARWFGELRVALLVELPEPVWVLGPVEEPAEAGQFPYEQFALTVAYWLWQSGEHIRPLVAELLMRHGTVAVEVEVEDPAGWVGDYHGSGESQTAEAQAANGRIKLRFPVTAQISLKGPDNAAERELLRVTLAALGELAAASGINEAGLGEQELARLVDEVAPLGLKQHLLLTDADGPDTPHSALPDFRPVQDADRARVTSAIGEFLLGEGRSPGEVPDDERTDLLRQAVSVCREQITTELDVLAPGAIDELVARNEAILVEQARRRLTTPTRLACYEGQAKTARRLAEEMPQANAAGVSVRYLIEQVTAAPPTGDGELSLARFDWLIALAAEMVNLAYLSDAIYYELSPARLRLLEDGRISADGQETYAAGQLEYLYEYVAAEIDRSGRQFANRMAPPEASEHGDDPLDPGLIAEAGFAVATFFTGAAALMDLARQESEHGVARVTSADAAAALTDTGLGRSEAEALIEFLALRPREDFLKPPEPFRPSDVDPWRFNRQLSYARRPLLVVAGEAGREDLLVPVRHLFRSVGLIESLLRTGKYRARTAKLAAVMGELADQRGREFEDEVAETFANVGYEVRTRIDKFGKQRMADANNDSLGDIDVLAIDRRRCVLRAVDAKDLTVGLTPSEIAREIGRTFQTTGTRLAAADKHLKRVEWMRQHIGEVHQALGLEHKARRWKVEPLIVVDQEVASPYLVKRPVPVMSIRQLRASLVESEPRGKEPTPPASLHGKQPTGRKRRRRRRRG